MSDGTVRRITGWGRVGGSLSRVHQAAGESDVARLVRAAAAGGLLPRGLGRSYGDAALNDGGTVLAPIAPGAQIDLDSCSGTVRVSAGASLDRITTFLLSHRRRLPVLPGTRHVTVGGAVAADVHGKNHHVDGSFSRHVRELTLVDGTGTTHVLAPDRDPEAFWATTGGMGLTGVVTSAVLATEPARSARLRVRTRRFTALDEALDAMERSPARYHVAWVDAAPGSGFGRCVLDEGDEDATPGAPTTRTTPRAIPAPRLPLNAVRPEVVRLFNEAWWRRSGRSGEASVPMAKFFHPLDGVQAWPRLYGPRGFLQWQIAVPHDARGLLEQSLRAIGAAGAVPSLVVLKRFGDGTPGPLSFPIAGWTLAVDVPAGHPRLRPVLDELDDRVADAGGRIYLAKDARAQRRQIERMYPKLAQWRATRERLDPLGCFGSDLARRLGLV